MSEFRKHLDSLDWTFFEQQLQETLPGKLVHQIGVLELIDYGGAGVVYATAFEDTSSRTCDTVAIKLLRTKNADVAVTLPEELRIMSRLKHNHIVAYVGSFHRKGQFALLMYPVAIYNLAEYLSSAAEEDHLGLEINLPRSRVLLRAFGCLSSALMYLHVSLRVKHKDIKPENILVDQYGSVLLADFGISKQYEADTVTEGMTPFTDKYAPPEVVGRDKRNLSADIFSLGCVFLEMMTVVLGETMDNMIDAIFNTDNRPSYRLSQPKVTAWVNKLKRQLAATPNRLVVLGPSLDNPLPTPQHLDIIRLMISESPEERPSISTIHKMFKHFASQCKECQSARVSLILPDVSLTADFNVV